MNRNRTVWLAGLLTAICLGTANAQAAPTSTEQPAVFSPGVISGPGGEASPAFTPDGNEVYFMYNAGHDWTIRQSKRVNGHWTKPVTAPFSGHWRDLDPAMAPDGSFLVFVSNRPAQKGGKAIAAVSHGKVYPGKGMNLWRVARKGSGWSKPIRLPDTVNRCNMTFAPTVAADGSLYFIGCAPSGGSLRLLRAQFKGDHYLAPKAVTLGGPNAQIRDPAIAPDESFIVFSIKKAHSKQPYRLAIAFRQDGHWSKPIDLGDAVNGKTYAMGSRLGPPDHHTLYYYTDRRVKGVNAAWNDGDANIWRVSLTRWLRAHKENPTSRHRH